MTNAIGIVGGSGLYEMEGFQSHKKHKVSTPFGQPSDSIIEGRLHKRTVFFLPRHGIGHKLLPTEINYRANIYALKKLGVRNIVSVSAVGSLQKQFKPGDFVLADQFVDRTKGMRKSSFFGQGCVGHVSMAHPVCSRTQLQALHAGKNLKIEIHPQGTYVCMEGPNFSTRAESIANHKAGFSVIGMTNVPEAYLAREAGICYCTIAMVTDFDSWSEEEAAVSADTVLAVMSKNIAKVKQLVSRVIAEFEDNPDCSCRKANQHAVVTNEKLIPKKTKTTLKVVLSK